MQKKICKICFRDFACETLASFFDRSAVICPECYRKINHCLSLGRIGGVRLMSLGRYGPPASELLIRYKESLDYELRGVFLSHLVPLLKAIWSGWTLVLVPSSPSNLKRRGFNHLQGIYESLGLKTINILEKAESTPQKKKGRIERSQAGALFSLSDVSPLKGKKILLADDVVTSGVTLKSCLSLISSLGPRKVAALVLMTDSDISLYS